MGVVTRLGDVSRSRSMTPDWDMAFFSFCAVVRLKVRKLRAFHTNTLIRMFFTNTHFHSLRETIDHFKFSLLMNSCSVFSMVGKN